MKTKLTPEQDYRWEQLFSMSIQDGMTDLEADEEAWAGICEEWPDLASFEGCLP